MFQGKCMFHWRPVARIAVFGLVIASFPAPVMAADPFVLFLLRMMRDQALSGAIDSGVSALQKPAAPDGAMVPRPAPQPPAEGQWLKGLIDESFIHLGPQQREELHASVMKILADPGNAPNRSEILAEFTRQAVAMRDAHRQLSRLSESDMQRIAAEARAEFSKLPPDERQQLMQGLQQGVPGVPRALREMMLAEFASVPPGR